MEGGYTDSKPDPRSYESRPREVRRAVRVDRMIELLREAETIALELWGSNPSERAKGDCHVGVAHSMDANDYVSRQAFSVTIETVVR
jgi:hypothetical protein